MTRVLTRLWVTLAIMVLVYTFYMYPAPLEVVRPKDIQWGESYDIFQLAPELRWRFPNYPSVTVNTPHLPDFPAVENLGMTQEYVTEVWWVGQPYLAVDGETGGVDWELHLKINSGQVYTIFQFGDEFLFSRCTQWRVQPRKDIIIPDGKQGCQSGSGGQQINKPNFWPEPNRWKK